MSHLIQTHASPITLPEPRTPIRIRPAVLSDVPFLDALQKRHTKQVGWMPTAQLVGKIKLGHVLVAEATVGSSEWVVGRAENATSSLPTTNHPLPTSPVGYCIGNDQYFKRDDVGIIYQMNVLPGHQRGLIGANLLRAMFERSAYGCRLFCCWCAQDIEANRFWESMGFVALAFRTGSRTKGAKATPRVHIFWQKRIREGDTGDVTQGGTPWWFPSQTSSGSIREDRLVLPIPPGTHWSDAKPPVLPGSPLEMTTVDIATSALPSPRKKRVVQSDATVVPAVTVPVIGRQQISAGGLRFGPASNHVMNFQTVPVLMAVEATPKPKREKPKNDPRLIAAARELRDRWLEQVNATPMINAGKYDVSRSIDSTTDGRQGLMQSVFVEDYPALPSPVAA